MQQYDLVLKNGQCFINGKLEKVDVGIVGEEIRFVGDLSAQDLTSSGECLDCQGLTVLPGIIDTQVHFREPGLVHKEDLESGSKSAALGGITTFFEMPNTTPPTISAEALTHKVQLGMKKSWVDFAFFMGASRENAHELAELEKTPGCCGVKIFLGSSTGPLLLDEEEALMKIFTTTQKTISIHSENEKLLKERTPIKETAKTAHAHADWRNVETALTATQRIVNLARKAKRKIHLLHISTKDEMEFLAKNKDICTVEVLPQHLTLFSPDCYDRLGTYAQMNPPIRTKDHQEGLWNGIQSGVVDIIGSDHAPHTREEKEKGYPHSPSGMPGVQTILPLMLNHVHEKKLSLERLIELMVTNPVKIFQLEKRGTIATGMQANFSIVDLKHQETISSSKMATKSGWTPFDGMKVTGWPMMTIVRGHLVMREGEVQGKPCGHHLF